MRTVQGSFVVTTVVWLSFYLATSLGGELEDETAALIRKLPSSTKEEAEQILDRIAEIGPEATQAQDTLFELLDDTELGNAAGRTLICLDCEAISLLHQALTSKTKRDNGWLLGFIPDLGTRAELLVPDLVELVIDPNSKRNSEFVSTLGQLRIAEATPALQSAISMIEKGLQSHDGEVAERSAEHLRKLGRFAKQSAPALVTATLTHPDPRVRYTAIIALSDIGAPDEVFVPCLALALSDRGDANIGVRHAALDQLARIGKRSSKSMQAVLQFVKEQDFHIHGSRNRSHCLLGEFGNPKAIPLLEIVVGLQHHPSDVPRSHEFMRIRDRVIPSNYKSALRQTIALAALARLQQDNGNLIKRLREILVDDAWSFAESREGVMWNWLEDPRAVAARSLGRLGQSAAWTVPDLKRKLDPNAKTQSDLMVAAAWAVAQLDPNDRDCLKIIERELVESSHCQRSPFFGQSPEDIIKILGNRIEELSFPFGPEDHVKSWDKYDTRFAAELLHLAGPTTLRKNVRRHLARIHPTKYVHFRVQETFDLLGPRVLPALDVLVEALDSHEHRVRAAAADWIGSIGPPANSAIPHLKAALLDERVLVRLRATEAIGKIASNSDDAVEALRSLESDAYHSVREAAATALQSIRSHDAANLK